VVDRKVAPDPLAVLPTLGIVDDERHPGADLVEGAVLGPFALLAEVVAVVAPEDDEVFSLKPRRSSASSTRPTCASMKLVEAQ